MGKLIIICLGIIVLIVGYFAYVFLALPISIQTGKRVIDEKTVDYMSLRIHYQIFDYHDQSDIDNIAIINGLVKQPIDGYGIVDDTYLDDGNVYWGQCSMVVITYSQKLIDVDKQVPVYYVRESGSKMCLGRKYIIVSRYRHQVRRVF